MGLLKDFFNLLKGMTITGKHLGRRAVTIQYPEQKMQMFERSRGVVVLLSDKETGDLNCTMCMLCMRACPTAAIYIDAPRDENKKRVLKEFKVDHALCCYCGLCEEACNFSAIKLANKYEFSTWEIGDLVWDVKKLQDVGRDVPYVDTRKKKPAAKAAAKPAEKKADDEKSAADEAKPSAEEKKPSEGDKPSEPKVTDTAAADKTAPAKDEKAVDSSRDETPESDETRRSADDDTKKGDA